MELGDLGQVAGHDSVVIIPYNFAAIYSKYFRLCVLVSFDTYLWASGREWVRPFLSPFWSYHYEFNKVFKWGRKERGRVMIIAPNVTLIDRLV